MRTLFNFDPPTKGEEIRAASLQFVRKLSGLTKPSRVNETAFFAAVEEIARISGRLLASLESGAPSKNCQEAEANAKARSRRRFE